MSGNGYFQPWYTVFIVSISFVCLVKDYVQSDLLFCAALALLITGKVITVEAVSYTHLTLPTKA